MKRVLLAEDNAHMRELIGDYLEENGFEVEGGSRRACCLGDVSDWKLSAHTSGCDDAGDGWIYPVPEHTGKRKCADPVSDRPGTGGGSASGGTGWGRTTIS